MLEESKRETIRKLRVAKDSILKNSKHFDMSSWHDLSFHEDTSLMKENQFLKNENCKVNSCGTTHCIAGFLQILFVDPEKRETSNLRITSQVSQALGDPPSLSLLFHKIYWPPDLKFAYENAENHDEAAGAACDAIEWYIKRYLS